MDRIYFDNAATTPLEPEVIEIMRDAMHRYYGNPSSIHAEGRQARAAVEEARKKVARVIGASIGEVFFTSGGSESNNMVLKNAVRDLGVQRIITTRTEHHCVLHSVQRLVKDGHVEAVWLDQDRLGRIDPAQLERALRREERKTLVSLMHSNNEIGTMIDLGSIASLCAEYGALFHSDTVQTMGYFPMDVSRLPIHFLAGSAHKFHGPKGVGFVYIRGDNKLRPFIDGGAQERNMRGGTENIYGILGLANALELAHQNREERREHITGLRDYLADALKQRYEGLTFHGDLQGRNHYKLLSVAFPPSPKAELLLLNLDIAGIAVSGGSACSSGADAGSHVLAALHGNEDESRMIRFSFSHHNTRDEVDYLLRKLEEILPVSVGSGG